MPSQFQKLPRPLATLFMLLILPVSVIHAHGLGPMLGERPLDWQTDQISDVVATGPFGTSDDRGVGQVVTLDGMKCLEGTSFYFKVRNQFGFDIDETVALNVTFYRRAQASAVEVRYERNGVAEAAVQEKIPEYKDGPRSHTATFALERARFAHQGWFLSDFSIGLSAEGYTGNQKITICGVSLKRTYTTASVKSYGEIALEVADETGKLVPARVGIYDQTGRLPLPSDEALASKRFNDVIRIVTLRKESIAWPHSNPSVFYIRGLYHARVPVGTYELIVAKGPEYRIQRKTITVREHQTLPINVKLQRWDNLPKKGWYSGDNHIHYIRENRGDDEAILGLAAAEDLHVANILQAGHAGGIFFSQYDWKPVSSQEDSTYSVVPGLEDPRSNRRGHTISLNVRSPLRDPEHYFLYHIALTQLRAQGSVTGYAHVLSPEGAFYARVGLALDVPFGLVDFAELMEFGTWSTEAWFDFLNLGYKLLPAAGTDYPYGNIPGADRDYVRVRGPFTTQGWFDGWRRGEVFVSNGPILELSVNGKEMGSELHLRSGEKLTVTAKAGINPDIDTLDRLELVEQGEVVRSVRAAGERGTTLQLTYETKAKHGSWFIVRAYGRKPRDNPAMDASVPKESKAAFSAPVYIFVDGKSFWKPAAVPSIVARLKQDMTTLMRTEGGPESCTTETWDAGGPCLQNWDATKDALQKRVNEATAMYDDLVRRANDPSRL